MKKYNPLNISIPSPCQEDWNNMTQEENGRFCKACSNTVYDFSKMTDKELITFFKNYPVFACGRFREGQLNRDIVLPAQRNIIAKAMQYAVATFMAVLSLKNSMGAPLKRFHAVYKNFTIRPQPNSLPPGDSVNIKGKVTDTSGRAIANVDILFDGRSQTHSDELGYFSFNTTTDISADHYLVFIVKGYLSPVMNIGRVRRDAEYNAKLDKNTSSDQMILGKPASLGKNLFFDKNSTRMMARGTPVTKTIIQILKEHPTYKLMVEGHTDNTEYDRNMQLSRARAAVVTKCITDAGIDASRILSEAYGSERPIASNKTADGRAKNRRVQLNLRNY